ncbi:hypothetical protein Tco_0658636 [Tanacetum coccineum]
MSADSVVTYTSVHSEARSWSIPSEDPYEEVAQQLLEHAPRSPEYVPDPMELEDHVPVYIPEPEHPEDLVPAEDEAPTSLLPSSTYHSLLPSGTPPLLPIPLPAPSTSRRADIRHYTHHGPTVFTYTTTAHPLPADLFPRADTPASKETTTYYPRPGSEMERLSAGCLLRDSQDPLWPIESIISRQDLARSEAYSRTLEARITLLETEARRHEWQRQTADDLAVQHIMRTQALEAGACVDTLEDTGSSS